MDPGSKATSNWHSPDLFGPVGAGRDAPLSSVVVEMGHTNIIRITDQLIYSNCRLPFDARLFRGCRLPSAETPAANQ